MSTAEQGIPRGGLPRPVPDDWVVYTDIAHLATQDDELGDITNAAIVVHGNVVDWVGPAGSIPETLPSDARRVSLTGQVVIPGLINTHHHMYQTLTRSIAKASRPAGSVFNSMPARATCPGPCREGRGVWGPRPGSAAWVLG